MKNSKNEKINRLVNMFMPAVSAERTVLDAIQNEENECDLLHILPHDSIDYFDVPVLAVF